MKQFIFITVLIISSTVFAAAVSSDDPHGSARESWKVCGGPYLSSAMQMTGKIDSQNAEYDVINTIKCLKRVNDTYYIEFTSVPTWGSYWFIYYKLNARTGLIEIECSPPQMQGLPFGQDPNCRQFYREIQ